MRTGCAHHQIGSRCDQTLKAIRSYGERGDRDAYAVCPSPSRGCAESATANDRSRRARTRVLEANIAYGVGGAALVAAAVLSFTGARDSSVAVPSTLGAVTGIDLAASL